MNTRAITVPHAALAIALALLLALLSSLVESEGPDLEVYGNLCGAARNEFCYKPALKAGFPLPYLFDMQGVSIERQLSFVEDTIRPLPLLLDFAVYLVGTLAILRFAKRTRLASKGSSNGEA